MEWLGVIGPEFVSTFKDRTHEESLAAFSELIATGFNPVDVVTITYPLIREGNAQLAFELSTKCSSSGLGRVLFLTKSYGYLKKWKGKDPAINWIRPLIPSEMMNPASMLFFEGKKYELLWDLVPDPAQGVFGGDFVWLLRAAASVAMGMENDPHREVLLAYYQGKDPAKVINAGGRYHILGRFLMGLSTEEEVLSLAKDAKSRCETAYYVGLKAQAEGRFEDACDWYRVSIETGRINDGEYRWAFDTLTVWQTQGKSLARLAAQRDLPKD